MAQFKNVNGVSVQLTSEEEAIIATENAQWLASANDRAEEAVRKERNALLSATDWMALTDRTLTQAEIDYRQNLRDITSQIGFPDNVVWPTEI